MKARGSTVVVALVLGCAFVVLLGASGSPLSGGQEQVRSAVGATNVTPDAAVQLVPDGSSVTQTVAADDTRWYAVRVEAGKGYLVEAMHSGRSRQVNDIYMDLWENDGTTPWSDFSSCDAATNSAPPSMQASSAGESLEDGKRCAVAVYTASTAKLLLIRMTGTYAAPLMVRVRENTIYGRYTVNGYNMYVAIHNPSSTPVSGFVLYFPENATNTATSFGSTYDTFDVGGYGSVQFSRPADSLAAPANRGQVRIYTWRGSDVHVQLYAFNSGANNYLFFTPQRTNNGNGNSW